VALRAARLEGGPTAGESIEAWARRGRYRALAAMAHDAGTDLVLLAHHRRDQAETVLLQALRGAGPAGLSAMPREAFRDGIHWCRPWLEWPAEAIAAYVRRHRLSHIEDDSNLDRRFDRNRLRHGVWPVLLAAFPQAESSFLHLAGQAQWAQRLIDEVAEADLRACIASADARQALDTAALQALTPARRIGALRRWLAGEGVTHGLDRLAQRVAEELPGLSAGRWLVDTKCELRLYRRRLSVVPAPSTPTTELPSSEVPAPGSPGLHVLPAWGGVLELSPAVQGGVSPSLLATASVRARRPGDQFQFSARSGARSLKKQYQDRAVPAWQRGGPIIAAGELIVFVPGLGIDARAMAKADEPQLAIRWLPDG
jgi:tRNA(Ile)-lysidine synthase